MCEVDYRHMCSQTTRAPSLQLHTCEYDSSHITPNISALSLIECVCWNLFYKLELGLHTAYSVVNNMIDRIREFNVFEQLYGACDSM